MARAAVTARGQWVRIVLTVPALLAIFGLGIAILHGRAWRLDLTPEQRYTLSLRARALLENLPHELRITAFIRTQDPHNLAIRDLLRQVEASSRRVQIELLDVNRNPAVARDFGVRGVAFVLESADRSRVVSNPNEATLIAGIEHVMRRDRQRLAWVVGHGEGDLEAVERRTGFAHVRRLLDQEHYDIEPVGLGEGAGPIETDVLVVAGPRENFLPEELVVLNRYLQRTGRALVLLDPLRAPQLAAFLSRYGVVLREDVVVDPSARLYGGEEVTMRLTLDQRAHPIVAPLAAAPLFSRARSVQVAPRPREGIRGTEFLFASRDSFATNDPDVLRTGRGHFVPDRDRRGPVAVGAEVTFPLPGKGEREGRLIVYGNAEFATNFFIDFLGNKDLFLNTVAWLTHAEGGVTHRTPTQRPGINQFFVSDGQGRRIFWLAAVLQPAAFAVVALGMALWRRWV
jgi:ABC-type uncharacterized transport system involved in gliding motility auxiliary subunit